MILLVHHGRALEAHEDAMRPLSTPGLEASERLATDAAERGVRPDEIWHSGKLRARQTAEIFRRVCNPFARCSAVRGLQPGDPPMWIRDQLAGDPRTLLVVGHMPHLPRLLALLLGAPGSAPEFPLHGAVALDEHEGAWREIWRLG